MRRAFHQLTTRLSARPALAQETGPPLPGVTGGAPAGQAHPMGGTQENRHEHLSAPQGRCRRETEGPRQRISGSLRE